MSYPQQTWHMDKSFLCFVIWWKVPRLTHSNLSCQPNWCSSHLGFYEKVNKMCTAQFLFQSSTKWAKIVFRPNVTKRICWLFDLWKDLFFTAKWNWGEAANQKVSSYIGQASVNWLEIAWNICIALWGETHHALAQTRKSTTPLARYSILCIDGFNTMVCGMIHDICFTLLALLYHSEYICDILNLFRYKWMCWDTKPVWIQLELY